MLDLFPLWDAAACIAFAHRAAERVGWPDDAGPPRMDMDGRCDVCFDRASTSPCARCVKGNRLARINEGWDRDSMMDPPESKSTNGRFRG